MGTVAVLPDIDALPGSQNRSSPGNWNRELCLGERRADVRGHIVRPFRGMAVEPLIFRNQPPEELLQVMDDVWIGVFLDHQGCRGVLDKYGQQSISGL